MTGEADRLDWGLRGPVRDPAIQLASEGNEHVDRVGGLALVPASQRGGVPEWLKGADCKSAGVRLRWFESNPLHQDFPYFS